MGSRRRVLAWTLAGTFPLPAHAITADSPPPLIALDGWSYDESKGNSHWGGSCAEGRSQSPIDLPPQPAAAALSQKRLKLKYPRFGIARGRNNAHGSPEIDFDNSAYCEVDGEKYRLVQAHFHVPSEHALGGVHSIMECHLVHRSAEDGQKTVVIASLFKLGNENTVLQAALDVEPEASGVAVPLPRAISLLSLVPAPRPALGGRPFYEYSGSLTTPPCSEPVQWFVFMDPVEVSAAQVVEFLLHGGGNKTLKFNARPEQPIAGRPVKYGVA